MPLSVQVGLLLAVATAFVSILGFLYKYRGAADAPPVEWRHPIRSSLTLFSNKWYTLGIVVATASWGFHVGALALAPISVVQSVIAGGLVLLTPVADRMFGHRVTRREWVGVAVTAAGLAFLAATLGRTADAKHSSYHGATLTIYVAALAAASVPLMFAARREGPRAPTLLGAAAGLQWGASDVTIKAASGHLGHDGAGILFTPLAAAILLLSLVGLVVSARSLQLGDAVPVIAVTTASANLVTIASGLVVFGEPLPSGSLAVVLRVLAFALVIGAAALTPAPLPPKEQPQGG